MSALIPAIINLLMKGRGGGGGGGAPAPQKSDQDKHQEYWNRELLKMLADKSGPDINIGGGRGGGSYGGATKPAESPAPYSNIEPPRTRGK
jgi:hypothetical protein